MRGVYLPCDQWRADARARRQQRRPVLCEPSSTEHGLRPCVRPAVCSGVRRQPLNAYLRDQRERWRRYDRRARVLRVYVRREQHRECGDLCGLLKLQRFGNLSDMHSRVRSWLSRHERGIQHFAHMWFEWGFRRRREFVGLYRYCVRVGVCVSLVRCIMLCCCQKICVK